jgi:16S rRNA processing protein RimM
MDFMPEGGFGVICLADFLTIARLHKTQGRIGEISADLLTDFPERFAERKQVLLCNAKGERRAAVIENYWFHKGRVVLKFAGVDSISEAEALLGEEVQIPASEAALLDKDEVFIHELVGCKLFDVTSNQEAGVIEEVVAGAGSASLLIVKNKTQQKEIEHMIPFAAEYVEHIDTPNKIIRMRLPAGLLEVNLPNYDDGILPDDPERPKPAKKEAS